MDISIEKGTIHSLIGPNGAGKTTFFNVITGLLSATRGDVYLEGKKITNLSPEKIIETGIARTFQMPRVLPDMTCLENVMLGMHCLTKADLIGTVFRIPFTKSYQEEKMQERANELLKFVGLEGYGERVASELAWVEEQLVQLSRAIASNPKVLLLDEPTAGMGHTETEKVRHIIQQIRSMGTTIVLVAHDIKLVMGISDKVTVLNFGNKIAEGTVDKVQNSKKVLEAYLGEE